MHITKKLNLFFLTVVFFMITAPGVIAQCTTTISSFPYTEGFETSDGGWFTGGTSSDWAWGPPTKPVINRAAVGANCWITGGLTVSAYNNGENSWLQSPCFDFSTLTNPEISFYLSWETERRFDGASLEYSLSGGTSWTLLGSAADNGCTASNWFNNTVVTYLGNTNGWSGNIQPTGGSCLGGGGSNGWLLARHELSFLAGEPSVIFRFRFAAGTTCNSYDGFAIDEIKINEIGPNAGDYTFTCNGNRDVSFNSTATGCITGYNWDFGDPTSGAANISTLPNPSHIFSTAGTYTATLTINYGNGPDITITKTFDILDVSINELIPVSCNGSMDGAIVALATGSSGYSYTWNTIPPQTTFDLNNIGAGTYTVLVTSASACPTIATYILTEPAAIIINTSITDATCNKNNGSITATVTGGTTPYSYTWSEGSTTTAINNLAPGNYFLNILDGNACPAFKNNLVVANISTPVPVSLGNDANICLGQTVVLKPGLFSSYRWQDNSTSPTFTVSNTGKYWVTVTNASGCTGSDTVKITVDCSDVYFPGAITADGNGKNDDFGPLGTLVASIRDYTLRVFDRYGQQVFISNDPYQRWNGSLKKYLYNTGTFAWIATYTLLGKKAPEMQQGTVIVIR